MDACLSDDVDLSLRGCSEVLASSDLDNEIRAEALAIRGWDHAVLSNAALAFLDLNMSIELKPDGVAARYYRGLLRNNRAEYEGARQDFEQALAHVERGSAMFAELTDLVDFAREGEPLERHWREYLSEIQKEADYRNWSAPPRDLYDQSHR